MYLEMDGTSNNKLSKGYVNFMQEKLRLAVALAVLKSKPEDITVENYILDLRNKFRPSSPDIVSINSDDYMYESDGTDISNVLPVGHENLDESRNILEDFPPLDPNVDLGPAEQVMDVTLDNIPELNEDISFEEDIHIDIDDIFAPNTNNVPTTNDKDINIQDTQIETDVFFANDENIVRTDNADLQNAIVIDLTDLNFKNDNHATNEINKIEEKPCGQSDRDNLTDINNILDKDLRQSIAENISKKESYKKTIDFKANDGIQSTYDEILTQLNDFGGHVTRNQQKPILDTQETILYNINDITQEYTHVSQSQDLININDKYYLASKHKALDNSKQVGENYESNKYKTTESNIKTNIKKTVTTNDSIHGETSIDKTAHTNEEDSQRNKERDTNSTRETQTTTQEFVLSPKHEVLPFKVVEEMNKIKHYLRMQRRASCDGYSTDSGYRSDSQTKSSFGRSVKWSERSLSQSAIAVSSYLATCRFTSSTLDVTQEMAQTLGELIDRLHSEQQYPQFLDDILDNVNNYLHAICYENNNLDDGTQCTEDFIHRFLIFNKSIHIIGYSIEKITSKLDEIHSKLTTTDDLYEVTNLTTVNNITYIFHVLEILLLLYLEKKEVSSRDNSQSSEVKRKTSISDIWKKKWDPNFKKESDITVTQKCITIKVAEVLNKIVLECMDSYSLISFAALQCFNVLQS